jgi:hypothetical protein
MPTATDTRGHLVPKYTSTFTDAGFSVSTIRFGNNPHVLVFSDCDAATDATVDANPDVQRLPDDLDSSPTSGQVTAIQNFLENNNIPAGWVSTAMSWRTIVRGVLGIFLFVQRYQGDGGPAVFTGGVTLNSTFSSLPQPVRAAMQQAAIEQGFDTSSLSGASTLRQILRTMGLQWGTTPILIGGLSI